MKNEIIESFKNAFYINYYNTFKVANNLFISFNHNELIKWKYNFKENNIDIINRKDIIYQSEIIEKNIIDKKLFLLTKYHDDQNIKLLLYVYK